MTSSTPRSSGIDANSRGIAVLIATLVVGFLLLLNAGTSSGTRSDASGDSPPTTVDISGVSDDADSTTSVPETDSTTTVPDQTTDPDRQPGDVVVAVLNGGGPAGTAGTTSATIVERGYQAGAVDNVSPGVAHLATTKVYYAEGYQAEATAVAELLGKPADAVEALPEPAPGAGIESANVVVVLGKDTPPGGGSDN